MKTGIFSLPGPMTYTEAVDYVKKIGANAFEPFASGAFAQPSVEDAKKLRDYAGEKGVDICCFSMLANVVTTDIKAEVERLKRYADVAAAMGSPFLHHTIMPAMAYTDGGLPFKEALRRAAGAIREVYDYAEQQGVKCAYEDQGFYFNGVERFDDLLGELNRDVGVVADLGNVLFVGEKPEAFVSRFASRICHVHVKDYLYKDAGWLHPGEGWYATRDGGYVRGTVIGHGTINFQRIFGILRSIGYSGYYSMEYCGMEEPFYGQRLSLDNMRKFDAISCVDMIDYKAIHL